DISTEIQKLVETVGKLEEEKQKIREEFGHQRAKMKELYLQKEAEQNRLLVEVQRLSSELDEAKSQLVVAGFRLESDLQDEKRKCQEEIASLQQIVQETVEESSSSRSKFESEVKRLRRANERMENEIQELRTLLQQQQGSSEKGERDTPIMAPGVMLSAVTKTLARKVVSQLGADPSSSSQDNLEDSMRKAQEDAEVLRSLVIPLEEEIQALKEKLRYTDQQLRKYEGDKAQEDAEVLRSLVIPLEEEIQALKEKLRYTDQQLRKYEGDKVRFDYFVICPSFSSVLAVAWWLNLLCHGRIN
ncbi:hypothetical protein C0J52_08449, partial [Blattella germanica]